MLQYTIRAVSGMSRKPDCTGSQSGPRSGIPGRRTVMLHRSVLAAIALLGLAGLWVSETNAQVFDYSRYPNFKGQWRPIGGPGRFDISKPAGRGQEAPLNPEYQAIFEANVVDQRSGGQGTTPTYRCISPGMPRVTNGYGELE